MAFEPYLFDRFQGCFKAPKVPRPEPDPHCSVDKYTSLFRDRWNLIRQDPCDKLKFTALNDACCSLDCAVKNCDKLCLNPGSWSDGQSLYSNNFQFPKSHNNVDDCCPSPCPCADGLPDYSRDSKNVAYCPTQQWCPPCPPMDNCTTYNHFYQPYEVLPRWRRPPEEYDPCECPLEAHQSGEPHCDSNNNNNNLHFGRSGQRTSDWAECTTTRMDYTKKTPIPNGPANAKVIKHGLWSCSQFCKDFSDVTTNQLHYPRKSCGRQPPIRPVGNFIIPCYPLKTDTETGSEFTCKEGEPVGCYHPWLDNDNWHKPETPLEKCTTYNHFYRPHYFPEPSKCTVESPPAIPFCSMNRLCYSCYDPVPDQRAPVEMKDNDPWPYVKPCQIRYQDNLQRDPCAKFNDDTTYKHDYWPKSLCKIREIYGPLNGFVPPISPMNDDTTMKVSYPAYNKCQYRYAKGCSGNPCGIKWGLNLCPENSNKCLPRFPSPYGHPIKPFSCQHCRCPCGPFDDRSTYNNDYMFRSKDEIDKREEEMCRQINVPQGITSNRFDFVKSIGKKAARMPPPISKGYRCMHPCSYRALDTLQRISYQDFWKTMKREDVERLRGKPAICEKKNDCCEDYVDNGEEEVLYQPILIRQPKKKCRPCPLPCRPLQLQPTCPPMEEMDLTQLDNPRCRAIPYSGANILNRAKTSGVCDGHEGQ